MNINRDINIVHLPNLLDYGILLNCLTVNILGDWDILKNNLANVAPEFCNNSKKKEFLFS